MLTSSFARDFVMQFMHYSGANNGELTSAQWARVYLNGDGFGIITREWAVEQSWDWSHVRDSSDKAIERMAREILAILAERGQ